MGVRLQLAEVSDKHQIILVTWELCSRILYCFIHTISMLLFNQVWMKKISFYFLFIRISMFLTPTHLHYYRQFTTVLQRQTWYYLLKKTVLIMSYKQDPQNINWILKYHSSELNHFLLWHQIFLYLYLTTPQGVQSIQDWRLRASIVSTAGKKIDLLLLHTKLHTLLDF